jgi:hypothetical protein
MLERVSLGQSRFKAPGVAADARGVLVGRLGALLFPSVDGVVGWLRLYSAEASLDELLGQTRVLRLRTALRSQAFLLCIPALSSAVLDRAARVARLCGAKTYTGTVKQFVKYRDERAPYGYDIAVPYPQSESCDLILYDEPATQAYAIEGELEVQKLVFRLSLLRVPGSERLDDDARAELFLTVPQGLVPGILRYLWRYRVSAELAMVWPETLAQGASRSAFSQTGGGRGYALVRVHELPARLLAGLLGLPGMGVFRPKTDNVAVEVGWDHPIELGALASLFERDRFYLFRGAGQALDVIVGPMTFSDTTRMTALVVADADPVPRQGVPASIPGSLAVTLRLVPSQAPPRRVVGTLISWQEAARLKCLIYALPPSSLSGHRVAVTERGILLYAKEGVEVVPLGTLLSEIESGILVPLGLELLPRVSAEVLRGSLGHRPGRLTVMASEGEPFFVEEAALEPLERRAVSSIEVPQVSPRAAPAAGSEVPSVVNDPMGAFALWGGL